MSLPLAICLIVRNEQANLPNCLRSIAGLGADIIVVDTGSTDRTREIALSFGARVFDFPWQDSFAAARNESLRHATGAWILWPDADGFFDEPNRDKLRTLVAGLHDEAAAYVMTQRSPSPGGHKAMRVRQVRLFRNLSTVRWEYRVHEQVLPAIRRAGHDVRQTGIVLQHTDYQDPAAGPRKLERNLRLLLLDQSDRPDDPFILFNLGTVYLELGRPAEALPLLRRSLDKSRPGDSIVPKLYAALAGAHHRLGQRDQALAVLAQGHVRWPDDAPLYFLEGQLRRAYGDLTGAEWHWRRVLKTVAQDADPDPSAPALFYDQDETLPHSARHQLALLCRERARPAEAEQLWRDLVTAQPDFTPALDGLGELFLAGQRWDELEQMAVRQEQTSGGTAQALVLRGRGCLARQEFAAGRGLLEQAIALAPQAVPPRLYLSHLLLQEGRDLAAAQQTLRALVILDPSGVGPWRNLAVLLHKQGRLAEAVTVCQSARAHCPADPELLLLCGRLLHEASDLAGAEACLVALLKQTSAFLGRVDSGPERDQRVTARHNLALICRRQGRLAEAERHWRAALDEMPDLDAAWIGLGETLIAQNRLAEVDSVLGHLNGRGQAAQAVLLRARLQWRRADHGEARRLLEEMLAADPKVKEARRLLSYVLLDEDKDRPRAEAVLREMLALDPGDAEARHNLSRLLRRQVGPDTTGAPAV